MMILTMANYEWFEEWKDNPVRKRGDDYLDYKMRFGKRLFDWACSYYPQLREKVAVISEMDFGGTSAVFNSCAQCNRGFKLRHSS